MTVNDYEGRVVDSDARDVAIVCGIFDHQSLSKTEKCCNGRHWASMESYVKSLR